MCTANSGWQERWRTAALHAEVLQPERWIFTVWLLGFSCAILPTSLGMSRLRRLKRSAEQVQSGPAWGLIQEWSAHTPARPVVASWRSEHCRMPMTWGMFRPHVLLPADFETWSEQRQYTGRAEGNGQDSVGRHDGVFPVPIRYAPGLHGQAFDFYRRYTVDSVSQRVSVPDSPDFAVENVTLAA